MQFYITDWHLGFMLTAKTAEGLRAVFIGPEATKLSEALYHYFPQAQFTPKNPELITISKALVHSVDSDHSYTGPLAMQGTPFQEKVWSVLRMIPRGETVSYTEVAQRIGAPKAYRAVASACGANLLAIAIPCHRVVGQQNLGGYRWGIELKRALLQKEQQS